MRALTHLVLYVCQLCARAVQAVRSENLYRGPCEHEGSLRIVSRRGVAGQ